MSFDLKEFTQNISDYGVSSPNKFEISLVLPPALQDFISDPDYTYLKQFQSIMPYRALNCNPPGVSLSTTETHNLGIGPRIKMPFNAVFGEFRVMLLADSESIIERTFNLWLNVAYNFTSVGSSFPTYYTKYRDEIVSPDIMIRKFDFSGHPLLDYHLYNALPIVFTGQALDWGSVNSLNKFNVTFHYTNYGLVTYKTSRVTTEGTTHDS